MPSTPRRSTVLHFVRIVSGAIRRSRSRYRPLLLAGAALSAIAAAGCGTSQRMAQRDETDPFLAHTPHHAAATTASNDPFATAPTSSMMSTAPGAAHVSDRHAVPPTFAAFLPQPAARATTATAPTQTPATSPVRPAANWWDEASPEPASGVATAGFVSEVVPTTDAPPEPGWQPTRQKQVAAKPFPADAP